MSNPNPPRKPIGFGTPNSTTPTDDNDDFFGTPKKTSPSRKAATQKRDQGNQIKRMISLIVRPLTQGMAISQNLNILTAISIFNK